MSSFTAMPSAVLEPIRPAPAAAEQRPARIPAVLLVILVAGLLVRLGLWFWFQDLPIRIEDEQDYNKLACNLVRYGEYSYNQGIPTSIRPPLYPALVAGLYALFGLENFQAVRLFQVFLSLGNVIVVYWLGTAVVSRRVGLLAAALFCFYPSLLGFNNLLLTEVLFTFLLCTTCYLLILALQRNSYKLLVTAAVSLGLAALTRSVLWVFPPVLGLFLLWAWPGTIRQRLAAAVTVGLVFAAVIAPWSIRNTRLEQTFIAIDSMGGRNVMMGNYEYTPLYRAWDAISIQGPESWDRVLAAKYPDDAQLTQGQRDKRALAEALQFARANPGLTAQRSLAKFFAFWQLERELVAGAGRGYFGKLPLIVLVGLTALIFGSYVTAFLAGLFGAICAPPPDRRYHLLLLGLIGFICALHTLSFGHSRYHLPLIPLVLIYAASAMIAAREIWERRCPGRFLLAGALSALFILVWSWEIVVLDLHRYLNMLRST